MNIERWVRTAAMLGSPALGAVTLTNFLWWLRVQGNKSARKEFACRFDHRHYLAAYSDVASAGVNPLPHYLFRGFLESRNPSNRFNTAHYLAVYPDVKKARINPLLHYALFGRYERRSVVPMRTGILEIHSPQDPVAEGNTRIDNDWPAGTPLVTVVIPCFNYGAYVEQALESVLAQTFRNFEVIVVEGGSTDGVTPQAVAAIEARQHQKIRVLYRSERHMAGDNRNYGIAQARGRYICCLDADDLLRPIYLETAVFLAEGYGFDIVSTSVKCFEEATPRRIFPDATFPAIAELNQIATTALFRKNAWEQAGGNRDWGVGAEHIPEDWDFWLRLLAKGYRAKAIPEPLMLYRVHGSSLARTCETSLDHQRAVLRQANAKLFEQSPVATPPSGIEIARRWVNLAVAEPGPPTVLIALPFITIGGAEQLFETVLKGLVAHGLRVLVTTSLEVPDTMKETPHRYDAITSYVYHLPHLLDLADHEDFLLYLLKRYAVGAVIVAGSALVYRALPRIRKSLPNIRIVDQQFNDTGHIENNRRYAAFIDQTVVPSTALASVLVDRFGESPDRVTLIPHGIETRLRRSDPDEAFRVSGLPAASRGKLLVSFLGRMSKEKSPEVFVEMAARLVHREDLFFLMTGEGPEYQAIQRLAVKYRLTDKLHLPGFVEDPRPLLELSGIVVLTSSIDGMPLVVLEAQALGKPVVASAVGSLPEMVRDGETGFLCPPGDIDAFCRAIGTLADSEELRRTFGHQARQFITGRYDSAVMVDSYVKALALSHGGESALVAV